MYSFRSPLNLFEVEVQKLVGLFHEVKLITS